MVIFIRFFLHQHQFLDIHRKIPHEHAILKIKFYDMHKSTLMLHETHHGKHLFFYVS